jgi:hypothetical protein
MKNKKYITLSKLKNLDESIDLFIDRFKYILSRFIQSEKEKEEIIEETPIYFIHNELIYKLLIKQENLEKENNALKEKVIDLDHRINAMKYATPFRVEPSDDNRRKYLDSYNKTIRNQPPTPREFDYYYDYANEINDFGSITKNNNNSFTITKTKQK